jgi:hypothetical protein
MGPTWPQIQFHKKTHRGRPTIGVKMGLKNLVRHPFPIFTSHF